MEEQRYTPELLNRIPQPGFLVREKRIFAVNQAAEAMLLSPGQDFPELLYTGANEYSTFQDGQLSVVLSIGGNHCNAVVTRMEDADLILLDPDAVSEEFRSMALIAMELRNPLMQAITSAQQIQGSQPAADKMNRSLMQLLRLVSNLSDISRYSQSSRMETRDVDAFLLELFEKAQTLTGSAISLTFDGLKQPVFSLIDPEQLERAVWNILSNCVKFLPRGGSIHAKLRWHGKFLHLTVEDSGSGIAENVRSTLFTRYLRQPSIEDNRYGLGLGLALVRTAAANHGGTVLISSGMDGGTRIVMTIALRQQEDPTLRSPLFRPDYTGGWDHGLVELSDCLGPDAYSNL